MIKKQDYHQAANLLERFNKMSTPTALSLYTGYLRSKKKEINESKRLLFRSQKTFIPFFKRKYRTYEDFSIMKKTIKSSYQVNRPFYFTGLNPKDHFKFMGVWQILRNIKHAREFRNISIELLGAKLNLEPKIIRKLKQTDLRCYRGIFL